MLCVVLGADAQPRAMAVLSMNAGLDSLALHAGEEELQRLLLPANIRPVLRSRQYPSDRFEYLVIASFVGNCSVDELSSPRLRKPNVLGESFLKSGRILPFLSVDCDRVVQALRPELDYLSVTLRRSILGRAIGRVMAHEIYHILAQTALHDESGAAKGSFSRTDLVSERFEFTRESLRQITAATAAASTANISIGQPVANARPGQNFD